MTHNELCMLDLYLSSAEGEHLVCPNREGKRNPNSDSRIPTEVGRDCGGLPAGGGVVR